MRVFFPYIILSACTFLSLSVLLAPICSTTPLTHVTPQAVSQMNQTNDQFFFEVVKKVLSHLGICFLLCGSGGGIKY